MFVHQWAQPGISTLHQTGVQPRSARQACADSVHVTSPDRLSLASAECSPRLSTSASAAGAGRPSKVTRLELDAETVYGSCSCAVGRMRKALRSGRFPWPSGIISTSPAAESPARLQPSKSWGALPGWIPPGSLSHGDCSGSLYCGVAMAENSAILGWSWPDSQGCKRA